MIPPVTAEPFARADTARFGARRMPRIDAARSYQAPLPEYLIEAKTPAMLSDDSHELERRPLASRPRQYRSD
jgi:hypothetical protein